MTLDRRSSLTQVALAVGDALRRAGIRAVLTGGACAALHSGGRYESLDADFVLAGITTRAELDDAMAGLGFRRNRDRYVHPRTRFFVEFPPGPLGIGEDYRIRPVWKGRRAARTLALSPTDSCRDRLAAYYHWRDRQALTAAIAIALNRRIDLAKVKRWSADEGESAAFDVFRAELARARGVRGRRKRSARPRPSR